MQRQKMFKITAIISLMLIATWSQADSRRHKKDATASGDFEPAGTTIWAASLSCDSCGSECASACGTRHFRSCCFNYLRRKRGPEAVKFLTASANENKLENPLKPRFPFFIVENIPEQWFSSIMSGGFKSYPIEDNVENRLQAYDR